MSTKFPLKILKFFQPVKLRYLKLIKNKTFYFYTTHTLKRIIMTELTSKQEIKNLFTNFSFYMEEMNIDYLNSESFNDLYRILSNFDYEIFICLDFRCSKISDSCIKFLIFCEFKQIRKFKIGSRYISDKAIKHLIS